MLESESNEASAELLQRYLCKTQRTTPRFPAQLPHPCVAIFPSPCISRQVPQAIYIVITASHPKSALVPKLVSMEIEDRWMRLDEIGVSTCWKSWNGERLAKADQPWRKSEVGAGFGVAPAGSLMWRWRIAMWCDFVETWEGRRGRWCNLIELSWRRALREARLRGSHVEKGVGWLEFWAWKVSRCCF